MTEQELLVGLATELEHRLGKKYQIIKYLSWTYPHITVYYKHIHICGIGIYDSNLQISPVKRSQNKEINLYNPDIDIIKETIRWLRRKVKRLHGK
jgi:hypothetical protein